jgi:hypothetical protein
MIITNQMELASRVAPSFSCAGQLAEAVEVAAVAAVYGGGGGRRLYHGSHGDAGPVPCGCNGQSLQ